MVRSCLSLKHVGRQHIQAFEVGLPLRIERQLAQRLLDQVAMATQVAALRLVDRARDPVRAEGAGQDGSCGGVELHELDAVDRERQAGGGKSRILLRLPELDHATSVTGSASETQRFTHCSSVSLR